jgi:tetratricopeptide (TPR) repeat protein
VTPARTNTEQERLDSALALTEHALRDAKATILSAAELLTEEKSDEAACAALRALGLAHKQRGELPAARTALTRAVRLGERLGYPLRAAQARTSLLIILADMGQTDAALAQAALAETALTELGEAATLDLARLQVNLGTLLQRTGRTSEALAHLAAAEPILVRHQDARWEILLRNLRGWPTAVTTQRRHETWSARRNSLWRTSTGC